MKNLKNVVAYLLILVLALSFAGCSKENSSNKDVKEESKSSKVSSTEETKDVSDMAAAFAEEKEETVNVKADSKGTAKSITVAESLSGVEENKLIKDVTELKDIMNTGGDEEFYEQGDGLIYWENHGADIEYEGNIEGKDVPVGVNITYKLDGKECEPEDIAGKSGKMEIRFDYVNDTEVKTKVKGKEYKTVVPFVALTMVPLDSDRFKHVEVENGKIMKMSGSTVAVGYSLPKVGKTINLKDWELTKDLKLEDYITIKADVTDFKLDYTATIFSNGLLKEVEEETFDDGDDMKEDMDDLGDASDELVDGTGKLYSGADKFGGYLDEYIKGAKDLSKGAKALSDGTKKLDSNGGKLVKGSKALRDGLKTLNTSLAAIDTSDSDNSDSDANAGLSKALKSLESDATKLNEGLTELSKAVAKETGKVPDFDASKVNSALNDMQTQAGIVGKYSEGMSEQLKEMASLPSTLKELKSGVSALYTGSDQLYTGIKAYTGGVNKVYKGSKQIAKGTKMFGSSGNKLGSGYDTMLVGMLALKNGFKTFNDDGIDAITSIAGEDMANTLIKLRALREADIDYKSFTKCDPKQKSSVKFVIETEEIK